MPNQDALYSQNQPISEIGRVKPTDAFESLRYPLTIGNMDAEEYVGDCVIFEIFDSVGNKLRDNARVEDIADGSYQANVNTVRENLAGGLKAIRDGVNNRTTFETGNIGQVFTKISDTLTGSITILNDAAKREFRETSSSYNTVKIKRQISIYMPNKLTQSNNFRWDAASTNWTRGTLSLISNTLANIGNNAGNDGNQLIQQLFASVAKFGLLGVGESIERLPFAQSALGVARLAINPQTAMLFQNVEPREFQFDFMFAPRNEMELNQVKKIIHTFQFFSHPELVGKSDSIVYGYPAIFRFAFYHMTKDGKMARNTNLFRSIDCACKNITVDYNPNSDRAFKTLKNTDGAPPVYRLSFTMVETTNLTRENAAEGYFGG